MVDALNLCPRRMKRALKDRDIKVQGRWPVKKSRHGEELVDYDTFIQDIEHNVCPSNLTFPVLVDLYELWEKTDYDELAIEQRSEEHTSELQSRGHHVCRLLL